ncbi:MAG: nucleoside deaminase [Candidatus ainarchaeum sp.]|nr:nucleoside deaminase [Candidatus ainarchaeum sp.]
MTFSTNDTKFMKIALKEAKQALNKGDYPVGAVLVINNKVVGKTRNSILTKMDWASHAEAKLMAKCSAAIKKSIKTDHANIELFTTLEPCLMCLGSAVLHRISRIVFACPDPHGGATNINQNSLKNWYKNNWPKIDGELLKEEAYKLMITFMEDKNTAPWKEIKILYENLHKSWLTKK